MKQKDLKLIACAAGLAGAYPDCADGPSVIHHSEYLTKLIVQGLPLEWFSTIEQPQLSSSMRIEDGVRIVCDELAQQVAMLVKNKQPTCVLGGDHTSAIGTFSGVYEAVHQQGDFGLIWLDAHMDSHTPETTESGRIHGMPLACLMGYGYPILTSVLSYAPKIKPENVCLIGVRSYEHGEAQLLERLNVRTFLMDEVKERGLEAVMQEALQRVNKTTIGYGVSLDLDVIDPMDAPGVGVPERDGIRANELLKSIQQLVQDPRLLAMEIAEFDPQRDQQQKTQKIVIALIEMLARTVKFPMGGVV